MDRYIRLDHMLSGLRWPAQSAPDEEPSVQFTFGSRTLGPYSWSCSMKNLSLCSADGGPAFARPLALEGLSERWPRVRTPLWAWLWLFGRANGPRFKQAGAR